MYYKYRDELYITILLLFYIIGRDKLSFLRLAANCNQ